MLKQLLTTIIFLSCCIVLQAEETKPETEPEPTPSFHRFSIALDKDFNHVSVSSLKIKERPWGGVINYEFCKPKCFFGSIEGYFGGGKATGKTYLSYRHKLYARGEAGYPIQWNDKFMFIPYTGIAYQKARNALSKFSYYKTEINSWYIPIGIIASYDINPNWKAAINAQGQWDVYKMYIYRTGLFAGTKTKSEKRFNWLIELPVTYKFCGSWDLRLTPYYAYERFVPRTSTYTTHQKHWGIRLGIGFWL